MPLNEAPMTGLAIGHEDRASATRRRKEQYRHELEQQMGGNNRLALVIYAYTVIDISISLRSSLQGIGLNRTPLALY